MANIGTLTANLRLESAAFMRDMTRASSAVASNTAQMRKSIRAVETATAGLGRAMGQLRGAAVALGGALAVRQFTQFTRAAVDGADALAKQAQQLGINAREFQRYRIEGELAGVSTEKLESGIGAFTKRVGELRAGTGTLVTILDKSNVALKNQLLAATSTEDGLRIMLAAIRDSGGAFDKTALSAAAFGRQAGQAMVLLARDMGTLTKEMVDLMVLSDAVLKAGENLNDEFFKLRAAFSAGFDSAIITGLSGAVVATTESLRTARETGEQFGRAVGTAMRGLADAAQFVGRNLREIATVIAGIVAYKFAGVLIGMALATGKLAFEIIALAKAIRAADIAATKTLPGLAAKLLALAAAAGAAKLGFDLLDEGVKSAIEGAESASKNGANNIVPAVDAITKKIIESTAALRLQTLQSKQLIGALGRSKKEYEDLAAAIEIETDAARLGVNLTTAQGKAWLAAAREAQTYKAQLDTVVKAEEERVKELKRIADQHREMMEEPISEAAPAVQDAYAAAFATIFEAEKPETEAEAPEVRAA